MIRELEGDMEYLRKKAIRLIDEWILTRERLQDTRKRLEKMKSCINP
jgi:hypothetical protein